VTPQAADPAKRLTIFHWREVPPPPDYKKSNKIINNFYEGKFPSLKDIRDMKFIKQL
jgi:hypothetical protein